MRCHTGKIFLAPLALSVFLLLGCGLTARGGAPDAALPPAAAATLAPGGAGELYQRHFGSSRRERLFLASLSFLIVFVIVRLITHAIHAGRGPFRDLSVKGKHIHHLVWGILLLLLVGYLWLAQVGTGDDASSRWASRLTALLYGAGAALTLDEFALWLNLQDVYWTRQGRVSIDAVVAFGALLSVGLWGGPFFRELVAVAARIFGTW